MASACHRSKKEDHSLCPSFFSKALACAARNAASKPTASRVELTGFTKPPSRRTLAIVRAARVRRWKGSEAYG